MGLLTLVRSVPSCSAMMPRTSSSTCLSSCEHLDRQDWTAFWQDHCLIWSSGPTGSRVPLHALRIARGAASSALEPPMVAPSGRLPVDRTRCCQHHPPSKVLI